MKEGKLMAMRDGNLGESIIEGAINDLDDTKQELLRLGHCQLTGCSKLFTR